MNPSTGGASKRVVLATWGSFGDLHPYVALGMELRRRGHRPVLATSEIYREKVEGEGLEFCPVRPNLDDPDHAADAMRKAMDTRTGSRYVLCEMLMPHLRDSYADLLAVSRGADLLVSHPITYGAPLAAAKLGLRWVSTVLQPMLFTSAYDPPVPTPLPEAVLLYRLGPWFSAALWNAARKAVRPWLAPVEQLRAELGLPDTGHPMFEGQFSPYANLALFSRELAAPQPDWPPETYVTGFPFYDRMLPGEGLPPELARFLETGPPPIVFTLGSSAVMIGDDFYLQSAEAVRRLGRRAVFLVGREDWNRLPDPLPEGTLACPYAPHGELFPHAAVIVHQGGVGTTGQAMRAGKPMLVVPFSHDQPDNAHRMARRGVARIVRRHRYNARTAARELRRLLEDPAYARAAAAMGAAVRAETGTVTAVDHLERILALNGPYPEPVRT